MFLSTVKNNYFSLIPLTSILISLFFDGSVIGFSLISLFLLVSFLSKSLYSILSTGILLHAFIFYLLGDVYSSNTSAGLWLQLFASWISAIIFVSRLAFLNPKIEAVFAAIFGTNEPCVSVDNWGVNRFGCLQLQRKFLKCFCVYF